MPTGTWDFSSGLNITLKMPVRSCGELWNSIHLIRSRTITLDECNSMRGYTRVLFRNWIVPELHGRPIRHFSWKLQMGTLPLDGGRRPASSPIACRLCSLARVKLPLLLGCCYPPGTTRLQSTCCAD